MLFSDYYPFACQSLRLGMLLPNRHESTNEYRYGFQGSEKDDEIKGEGNSYTTHFRQLDPRVGRWLSIDPKATPWESPYVSMGNNPIIYIDPQGDTVKYGGFRDRVNSFVGRVLSKDFRNKFKEWKNSTDVFRIDYDKTLGQTNLINAGCSCNDYNDDYMVYYKHGIGGVLKGAVDNWNPIFRIPIRVLSYPIKLGLDISISIIKIPIAIVSLGVIKIINLFRPDYKRIGWGFANRVEDNGFFAGAHLFSWGFGDYNKYNIFGMKHKPPINIYPTDGLVGIRWGQGRIQKGRRRPAGFIDIGPQIVINRTTAYFMHINLIFNKSTRRRLTGDDKIIDFKDNVGTGIAK